MLLLSKFFFILWIQIKFPAVAISSMMQEYPMFNVRDKRLSKHYWLRYLTQQQSNTPSYLSSVAAQVPVLKYEELHAKHS